MSTRRLYLAPLGAVLKRDLLIAWSYRVQFLTGPLGAVFTVATFYFVSRLVRLGPSQSPDDYFAFVAVGLLLYPILTATLMIPYATLRQELVAGTFERMLLSPAGPLTGMIALIAYPALYAFFSATLMAAVEVLAFGLDLRWSTVPLAVPLALVAVLAFAPIGIVLLAAVVVGKRAPPGVNYAFTGLALVAGLYFPISLLPNWIQWMSEVQPLTPGLDLLRWALVGKSPSEPVWLLLVKLVAFAAVTLPLSTAVLAWSVRLSRRRGTILEY